MAGDQSLLPTAPPWTDAYYIVREANGQALAYVYSRMVHHAT